MHVRRGKITFYQADSPAYVWDAEMVQKMDCIHNLSIRHPEEGDRYTLDLIRNDVGGFVGEVVNRTMRLHVVIAQLDETTWAGEWMEDGTVYPCILVFT